MQFLRRTWHKYSKLGRGRKSKQVWRKPTGRHNKMREKNRGVPVVVSLGYRTPKEERGLIEGKKPVRVLNLNDLKKIEKNEIVIVGKVGNKKMLEIIKVIKEKGLIVQNVNVNKKLRKEKRKIEKDSKSNKAKKENKEK
jgi:large subunit ribosomal protein L32e